MDSHYTAFGRDGRQERVLVFSSNCAYSPTEPITTILRYLTSMGGLFTVMHAKRRDETEVRLHWGPRHNSTETRLQFDDDSIVKVDSFH